MSVPLTIPPPPPASPDHQPMEGASQELKEATQRAFTAYDRSLRHGSLLEFLALRSAHAIPLQLVVTAMERTDAQSLAALKKGIGTPAEIPAIVLPPISEREESAGGGGG